MRSRAEGGAPAALERRRDASRPAGASSYHPPVFSPVPEILDELRAGRMIVLTDDESRENEGDLIIAAQFITPEVVSFMIREAAGYLFLSLTEADCDRLDLHAQTPVNTSVRGTPRLLPTEPVNRLGEHRQVRPQP